MGERIKQYRIISNWNLADQVYEMELEGDSSWITHPGQFLNVTIDNAYLKRPISICDWNENGLTIIYKVVGFGTKQMSQNSRASGWNVWSVWATALRRKPSMKKKCCWSAGASACRRSTDWQNVFEAGEAAGCDSRLYGGEGYFLHQEVCGSGLRRQAQHQ